MNALPRGFEVYGNPNSEARTELEAKLGPRRFAYFFRMAWPHIDPAHLLWNWHIDLLCEEMEAAARRHHREMVVCVPPRSLKSQILSVAFPAWVWTWFPSAKFITGSNEMTLATRDAVKTRRLVESEWYQRRWGPLSRYLQPLSDGRLNPGVRLAGDQNNKTYYETSAGGHRFCCTPGSNVTGHGGDFILVDDPHPTQKAESEAERNSVLTWWNEAIPTRLNEPDRGVKIVIQQRVHMRDLAGDCIGKGYYKVVLPMEFEVEHPDRHARDQREHEGELLHPARVNPEALASLKRALGTYGCTPHDAPVLMADLTMRPIGEVRVGEEVVGFAPGPVHPNAAYSRLHLERATVLNVFRYPGARLVKITLDSGEVIRCTPDHRWFKKVREKGRDWYSAVRVGHSLARVCPTRLPELSAEDERLAGWLSGFYDGEGTVSICRKDDPHYRNSARIGIFQGSGRNAPLCEKLEVALRQFGFDFTYSEDERKPKKDAPCYGYRAYTLRGDTLPLMQRFLHVVRPTKWRDRIIQGAYGAKFITGRERVVSIEPDGEEDVFALETTTGNYIVWGFASSNSAGQLQQRPSPRGGGVFETAKITIVDALPAEAMQLGRVRRWDLAATVAEAGKDPDWTAGVRMYKDNYGRFYIDDVTRFQQGPAEVEQVIKAVASQDGMSTRLILPEDPGQAGKSQVRYFASRFAPHPIEMVRETGEKTDRARSLMAQVSVGNLYLVRGKWNQAFLEELAEFPNGAHDDQVDAAVGAFVALMGGTDGMLEWMRQQIEALAPA